MTTKLTFITIAAISSLLVGCNSSSSTVRPQLDQVFRSICAIPMQGDTPLMFTVEEDTAKVSGVVCDGSPAAFSKMLAAHTNLKVLSLVNIDGSADDNANLQLGRLIRKSKMTTSIGEAGHIASGGTDLFLAGTKRKWTEGARIGVHSWSDGVNDGSNYPISSPEHKPYLDYYKEMGIPVSFYWFTLNAASASEMHYMTNDEIKQYGMVTEQSDDLGITPVPASLSSLYTKTLNFDRYTYLQAPNGKLIHIVSQDELTNNQIVRARSVLSHYLTNYTSSEYGSDKSAITNKMADNGSVLLLLNGSDDGRNPAAELDGQPLYQNEIQVEGGQWYINQNYDHRDATFEEILHMVHDYGFGVDQNESFLGTLPAYQAEIRSAQVKALTQKTWGGGDENQSWIQELTQENSLSQEYLAAVVDSYYGLWGAWSDNAVSENSSSSSERQKGMWGIYMAKTRAEIAVEDPLGSILMSKFFHPYLMYNARIDESFDGIFSLKFNTLKPYTNHSRYLKDITLTGSNDSDVIVNELDNVITGNSGDNMIIFSGDAESYTITKVSNRRYVIEDNRERRDGRVTVQDVESLKFKNVIKVL
ncbi:hypothetical protein [Photobacterium profundum]|uniref:Putative lipoprotein n=1 Tax=Photobacterium profundum 3TCK TaxID=314280 RepID=Q1YWQ7_9GAMM|nr:hypothetical protein [Photobacterium profundum]EAS40721.1 putative lipoprotein [Photobacterium profundum 3TCK]